MKPVFALLLLACMALLHPAIADPTVTFSEDFEELHGPKRLVQCENGNTFLISLNKRTGIETVLFDQDHKVISHETIVSTTWNTKEIGTSGINSVFAIHDKLYIFLQQDVAYTPALYRITLDATTGKQIDQQEVGTLPNYGKSVGWTMSTKAFKLSTKYFYILTDKHSDHYAIISVDGVESTPGKRIITTEYDATDKIVRTANYDEPAAIPYTYLRYVSAYMNDGNIVMCTQAITDRDDAKKPTALYISALWKGEQTIKHTQALPTADFKDMMGEIVVDKGRNISLVFNYEVDTKTAAFGNKTTIYYLTYFMSFDADLKKIASQPVRYEKTRQNLYKIYDGDKSIKDKFLGLPQYFGLRDDNTLDLIAIYDIVNVLNFDNTGNELHGYAIPRMEYACMSGSCFRCNWRDRGITSLYSLYKTGFDPEIYYTGVNTFAVGTERYFVFNDNPQNLDITDPKHMKSMGSISGSVGVFIKVDEGEMSRGLLFGEPTEGVKNTFADFNAAHFNPATKTYATLAMEVGKKGKREKIAWVKFE